MIQIDIDMPKRCEECPFCLDLDCILYGRVTNEYYVTTYEQYIHCPLKDVPDINVGDTISIRAAIDALEKEKPTLFVNKDGSIDPFGAGRQNQWYRDGIAIMNLPSAQPEYTEQDMREQFNAGYACGMHAAQPEQQWIPCDKGEPDEDMECWVAVKTTDALYRGNFTKRYGERRDKGFITSDGFMWWNTALAWMPIYEPEPYKGEQDGRDS